MMNLIGRHASARQSAWWVDLVLFKASWLALVLFQAGGVVWGVLLVALKLLFWPATLNRLAVAMLVFIAGTGMDLGLVAAGIFRFDRALLPPWLVLLWVSFALTVPRGFAFIGRMPPLWQSGLGMLGGVAGYLAGHLAGAVDFGFSLPATIAVIALCWALLVPLVFAAEQKIGAR